MSLDTEIRINGNVIGAVRIERAEGSFDTEPDSVNDYLWTYSPDGAEGNWTQPGSIRHRYGDGAVALVQSVLGEVDMRLAVAATYGKPPDPLALLRMCEDCEHRHIRPGGRYEPCEECKAAGSSCFVTVFDV